MIAALLFVVIAALLCACALLAILGTGQLALAGVDAIERDGLARGELAPAWSLADSAGATHQSPPVAPLQLIVFADHALKSFPSVVAGLRALRDGTPGALRPADPASVPSLAAGAARSDPAGLEIVIMPRGRSEIAEPVLTQLGLAGIPVLTGSPARYADYNVRVMPFAIFVDSAGRVRASSLVNHDWQLHKLRQIAAIPLDPSECGAARWPALTQARRSVRRWAGARRQPVASQPVASQPARLSGTAV